MVRKIDDELKLIARNLKPHTGKTNRRSPLFRWLNDHAEAFKRLLDDSQPSWHSVADALTLLDLRDGFGKPPTAIRVRRTWHQVVQVRARAKRPSPMPAVSSPTSLPPPVPDPVAYYSAADEDDGEFVLRTLTRLPKKG